MRKLQVAVALLLRKTMTQWKEHRSSNQYLGLGDTAQTAKRAGSHQKSDLHTLWADCT